MTPTTGDTPTTSGAPATTTGMGEMDPSSTTTAVPLSMCGNGVIEGEEACDDGIALNKPGNLCSKDCQAAACGDGDIQASNDEVCDDGALNTPQPGYGQCSTACQRGGYCGDGIVQPEGGEECEPSMDPDDAANCAAMCRHKPRFMFLTSMSYTGDLDGVAGADKVCNTLAATSPELTGTYRAWLLVDGQALVDRFPEFIEPASWNFTNLGAELLAKNFQDLVEFGPASPVVYTELGEPIPGARAWTNITGDGAAAGGDCAQWTAPDGEPALAGHTGHLPDQGAMSEQWHEGRWWTDLGGLKRACSKLTHLYCIQVGD